MAILILNWHEVVNDAAEGSPRIMPESPVDEVACAYAGYASSSALYFSVAARDNRFNPKEFVVVLESAGRFKAYPFSELERADGEVRDTFAGREVIVRFDAEHRTGAVYGLSGDVVPTITAYRFAWFAFHPDTDVYRADDDSPWDGSAPKVDMQMARQHRGIGDYAIVGDTRSVALISSAGSIDWLRWLRKPFPVWRAPGPRKSASLCHPPQRTPFSGRRQSAAPGTFGLALWNNQS